MRRTWPSGARVAALISLVCLAFANAAAAQSADFVYALRTVNGGANQLYGFSMDRTSGGLSALAGFPITVGTGTDVIAAQHVYYDAANARLYVLTDGDDTLRAYNINKTTGALTALPFSPLALGAGRWTCVTANPAGSIVIATDSSTPKVASFQVTAAAAAAAPGSPFLSSATAAGYSCEFSRDGAFLYVGGETGTTAIEGFAVNGGNGALAPLAGSPYAGGPNPNAYATDASGRLFTANFSGVNQELRVYTSASGVLTPVAGNPFPSGLGSVANGVLHPSGLYMVADRVSRTVGVFAIAGTGSGTTLAPVTGSPFLSGGDFTNILALNAPGTLLVASNGLISRNLTVFRVTPGSTPVLTSLVTQPANTLGTTGAITGLAVAESNIGVGTPTASLLPSDLNFGAVNTGGTLTLQTPAQSVALTFSGPGTVTWTAAANQPWLTVSPTSGTGAGTITVSVNNNGGILPPVGLLTGAVTVTTTGAANSPVLPINLTVIVPGGNTVPGGAFDTPTDGQGDVTGSIAVTGWAIDDIGISAVRVCREPLAGEIVPNQPLCGNQRNVFIGNAVLVLGARPDIAGLFPTKPYEQQAGWGYLMLTNYLPNEGNGTFRITAYAEDYDGFSSYLGVKTITCTNATATVPFGAIDTPEQGGTASGTAYANFGWVLAAQRTGLHSVIPPDGSTITVFIDSVPIGTLDVYDQQRTDIQTLFPGYFNSTPPRGAVGAKILNTTTLTTGVHTIAWVAQDTAGAAAGIGSRYFTVVNSGGPAATTLTVAAAGATAAPSTVIDARPAAAGTTSSLASLDSSSLAIGVRHGFDDGAAAELVTPDASGVRHVRVAQLDRVVIELDPAHEGGAAYRGYSIDGAALRALPVGSQLDAHTGTFAWSPGLAFGGTHALVFVREINGHTDQTRVEVAIDPQSFGTGEPRMTIDAPQANDTVGSRFTVAGWAFDPAGAAADSGIDTLHVWAYPVAGGAPIWAGVAAHHGIRPDVAAMFGSRFLDSGFGAEVSGLAPGTYDVVVYAHSAAAGRFTAARSVRVTVR